jgi:zinc transport system ATP-binding protein
MLEEVPHTGRVEFRSVEAGNLKKLRIGYVPQKLNIDRSTPMDVYDLIASFKSKYPIFLRSKKLYQEIKDALAIFQAEDLIDQPVGQLSGGQLQRVLLSMAVMDDPDLLLLDEPVAGIDQNGLDLFYKNMVYLRDHYDAAIIIISHDLDYVKKYADQVVLLDQTVKAHGTPKEVYDSEAFHQIFGEVEP